MCITIIVQQRIYVKNHKDKLRKKKEFIIKKNNREIINDDPEIITRTYYLKETVIIKKLIDEGISLKYVNERKTKPELFW